VTRQGRARLTRSGTVGGPLVWIVVVVGLAVSTPAAADPPPHIVFVLADDLGWADVGFHGGVAPTPHLDALARDSLELRRHFVAPVCSPTRAGLLTGRTWSRFSVTKPQNERALPWDTVTLPRALAEAGYETALVGKWHLGSRPEEGPDRFGFDHAYGSLAGGVTPWSHRYKQGPWTHTWHRAGVLVEEQGHVTDLVAAEAVRWIETRDATRPFFLYVPFTAVHLPVREPPAWLDRVPASITDTVARHYAASIMHLDDAVGRLRAALDRRGLRDRTLVVFTSDNGGSTAENNDPTYPDDGCPAGRLPGDNRPLRGQKGQLYDGGTRVPTLVSWPGRIAPGVSDVPVSIVDWMPTFCGLAGMRHRDLRWDGINLGELLLAGTPLAERPIYAVGTGGRDRSLRLGDWKLIVTGDLDAPRRVELFDTTADEGETIDRAAAEPERVATLLARMRELGHGDGESRVVH
jgi:arylsulfatase A-like enzyme